MPQLNKRVFMDGNFLSSLLPILIIIVIFYFLLVLPQKKAAKARAAMLDAIKAGDKVETVSRVLGTVVCVKGDSLVINIGNTQSVEIEINKEGVARVINENTLNSGDKAAQ